MGETLQSSEEGLQLEGKFNKLFLFALMGVVLSAYLFSLKCSDLSPEEERPSLLSKDLFFPALSFAF